MAEKRSLLDRLRNRDLLRAFAKQLNEYEETVKTMKAQNEKQSEVLKLQANVIKEAKEKMDEMDKELKRLTLRVNELMGPTEEKTEETQEVKTK